MFPTRDPGTEDDRGISEALGYVFLFSILIVGVGLVSASGLTFLTESSASEKIKNAERSMTSAAATLDEMQRQSDTVRSFNLPLSGGTVFLNESSINVSSPEDPSLNRTYDVNSLEQQFDRSPQDVTVAYEGGSVFRSPGARTRYRPAIECTENEVVISLVRLDGDNFRRSQGDDVNAILNPRSIPTEAPVGDFGRSLIFSARAADVQRNYTTFGSPGTVRVNVSKSANPAQWENYFERSGSEWVAASGPVYECENVDVVLVRMTTITLRL